MADIKLPKLPERTPIKLTISISPDLNQMLAEYASLYEAAYGQRESVGDLIPFMLARFLDSDRAFGRDRKMRDGKS